jgi:hypothetical protein
VIRILVLLALTLLNGCVATGPKRDFSALHNSAPRSILVVPAVNKSLDVDAPNYLLSTLPVPLAEKGYYVFPVHTAKTILEQEGLPEGEQVHAQPPEALARLFGADAILYVTIDRWDAQYAVISTTVTVAFEYRLVGKDGTELWKARQSMQYQPQNNSVGNPLATLVVAAVKAALTRAAPDYLPLAREANRQVMVLGPDALPDGPYRTAAAKP